MKPCALCGANCAAWTSSRGIEVTTSTHITTSGGLISAAFVENIREPGSRQRGVEPSSFAFKDTPPPKSPAALEDTIAAAWELLLEPWAKPP